MCCPIKSSNLTSIHVCWPDGHLDGLHFVHPMRQKPPQNWAPKPPTFAVATRQFSDRYLRECRFFWALSSKLSKISVTQFRHLQTFLWGTSGLEILQVVTVQPLAELVTQGVPGIKKKKTTFASGHQGCNLWCKLQHVWSIQNNIQCHFKQTPWWAFLAWFQLHRGIHISNVRTIFVRDVWNKQLQLNKRNSSLDPSSSIPFFRPAHFFCTAWS